MHYLNRFHASHASLTDELVTEFCGLWATPDAATLAGYFTKDAVHQNIPMQALHVRPAIKEFIEGFTAALDGIGFRIHRQLNDGQLVMNERTDVCYARTAVRFTFRSRESSRSGTDGSRHGAITPTWARSPGPSADLRRSFFLLRESAAI